MKMYIGQYKYIFGEYEVKLREGWVKAISCWSNYESFITTMTKDLNEPYVVIKRYIPPLILSVLKSHNRWNASKLPWFAERLPTVVVIKHNAKLNFADLENILFVGNYN